jgi:formamidopyrimidine-DNA glycosylase
MPELPDLQVFSHNLDKKLAGKTIEQVKLVNTKKAKTSAKAFQQHLEGQQLAKVYREGKELRFKCKNDEILGMHLMLHGQLHLFTKKNDQKHTIIELLFSDASGLALTDYQGIATPSLNPEENEAPDALSKKLTVAYLAENLGATRSIVKNVLLDQKVIRGIGNAYADEILWDAGISPFSISNKIPTTAIKKLVRSITTVLKNAEKQIRKFHPDLISGEIRDFLLIHHSKKIQSPSGAAIQQKAAGGRKTYFTEEQELFN